MDIYVVKNETRAEMRSRWVLCDISFEKGEIDGGISWAKSNSN